MTVYGLYVFDRHCTCTFYANYSGKGPRPGPSTLPNVYRPLPSTILSSSSTESKTALPPAPWEKNNSRGSTVIAEPVNGTSSEAPKGLAFDEEAKLVYGIVFSLRNMVQKLASKEDDSFHSFSTSSYKLHYLRTLTSLHFIIVTSPMSESLRFLLKQIYSGPFTDHIVRNPLVELDSRESGKGYDNDAFRAACDRLVKGI